jgi:hypothetical protein
MKKIAMCERVIAVHLFRLHAISLVFSAFSLERKTPRPFGRGAEN